MTYSWITDVGSNSQRTWFLILGALKIDVPRIHHACMYWLVFHDLFALCSMLHQTLFGSSVARSLQAFTAGFTSDSVGIWWG
jgi:hypothetical protein